ncbi:MAG: DUF169 domain-containing protein [candidate division KSB1 bacterium]|nr:DUF169 domain-containing protein [candidate division KSB1 bacterium]MDZ7335374.1 DUF169 domain-containing protein [candidate division KSB1 bacterium]MDZ7357674.1 DUF169 domain-containing protein [candidate division KSB1 bacterium]
MQSNPDLLIRRSGISLPLIGFYDAPDAAPFAPLIAPQPKTRNCVFAFFHRWLEGYTLHLTSDNFGCGGAGRWLFGQETRNRQDFIKFLVDEEGLKASHSLMGKWIEQAKPYQLDHPNLLIGPLKPALYQFLKTVTFFVNPDQLSLLMIGAQYESAPEDPSPVIAPFGSGCSQLAPLFPDITIPRAIIGGTDIAMRQYLPANLLAFTVTRPMFERLCRLDDRSFLFKPFWQRLRAARSQSQS